MDLYCSFQVGMTEGRSPGCMGGWKEEEAGIQRAGRGLHFPTCRGGWGRGRVACVSWALEGLAGAGRHGQLWSPCMCGQHWWSTDSEQYHQKKGAPGSEAGRHFALIQLKVSRDLSVPSPELHWRHRWPDLVRAQEETESRAWCCVALTAFSRGQVPCRILPASKCPEQCLAHVAGPWR